MPKFCLTFGLAVAVLASPSLAQELELRDAFDDRIKESYRTPNEVISMGIPSFEYTDQGVTSTDMEKPLTVLIDRALPFPTPRSITSKEILPGQMVIRSISSDEYIEEFCELARSDFTPFLDDARSSVTTMGQGFSLNSIPEFRDDVLEGPTVVLTFQMPRLESDCAIYSMQHGGIQRGQSYSGNIRSELADIGSYNVGLTGFVLFSPHRSSADFYQDRFNTLNGSKIANVLASVVSSAISRSQPPMQFYDEIVADPGADYCSCPDDRTLEDSWRLFDDPSTLWCLSNETNASGCSCTVESASFCIGEWVHEPRIANPRSWRLDTIREPLDALTFDPSGLPIRALVNELDFRINKQTGEYWCNVEPTFPCSSMSFTWFGGEPTNDVAELLRCGLDRQSCMETRTRTTPDLIEAKSEGFEGGRSVILNDDIESFIARARDGIVNAGDFNIFGLPFNFVRHGFDHSEMSLIDPRSLAGTPFVDQEICNTLPCDHLDFDEHKPHRNTLREYPFLIDVFLLVPRNQLASPVVNEFIKSYFPPPGTEGQCDGAIQMCSLMLGAFHDGKADMGTVWFPVMSSN